MWNKIRALLITSSGGATRNMFRFNFGKSISNWFSLCLSLLMTHFHHLRCLLHHPQHTKSWHSWNLQSTSLWVRTIFFSLNYPLNYDMRHRAMVKKCFIFHFLSKYHYMAKTATSFFRVNCCSLWHVCALRILAYILILCGEAKREM